MADSSVASSYWRILAALRHPGNSALRYWHQAQLRGAWMLVLEEVLLAEMEEDAGMIRSMP